MFNFQWPWMVVLLIVPTLMWLKNRDRSYASTDTQERKVTLIHPDLHNLQVAFHGEQPAMTLGSKVYYLLLALLWLGLTLAIMRPQWLEPHTEERSEGYDLMLAVDASHSMEALDFTGVGTLEAFNTDGLRTLLKTSQVAEMSEKTLRYPGHCERMAMLRYGVTDLRTFFENDLRFLQQFR